MSNDKRPITAEDLYKFQLVNSPQISPDGQQIIFSVQRVDDKTQKKYSNLWLVPTDGSQPARQFTYGDQSDTTPRWSPNGRFIAFLSNRKDEKQAQLYLIPTFGGEARPLTDFKGSIGYFEWSPDGSQFICQFRQKDEEAIEREKDEQKKKLGVVARHITRPEYKFDGAGYLPPNRWHLWRIDAETGAMTQLTDGDKYDEGNPRWSPDGQTILFFSNRSEQPDFDWHLMDMWTIPAEGGEMARLETPIGPKHSAAFAPDGQWIAFHCREGKGTPWKQTNLWLMPTDGAEAARNLTAVYDIELGSGTLTDTGDRGGQPPIWSPDGSRLYFQVTKHGRTQLCSIRPDGDDLRVEIDGGIVDSFSQDQAGEQLAYAYATHTDPGQVWVRQMAAGTAQRLTDCNDDWLAEVDLGQTEEVWYQGADDNDLQGWLVKPPGFDESQQYPAIIEIHGGPWLQYGRAFMHEFYYLAAQGYLVAFTNPRGGQGYGEAHAKAIDKTWGEADYADMMAWADYVEALPYVDRGRMGVTGGSYGGYMTTWIIGHTDRFKAAVAQRVVSNTISFWASSDVGFFFQDIWSGKPPWEDLDRYWDQSPIKYLHNAKTPTLVMHSEQDLRCNQEQGEQVFRTLQWLGVESELVLFPEESHGLSRNGRTDRRIARLEHMKRWFDKYLL